MRLTWFVILLIFSLVGCTTSAPDAETLNRKVSGPQAKTLNFPYSKVWRASLQVMGKYPLKTYDEETGVIETDFIRGDNVWTPPYKKKYVSGGYRYRLNVKIFKGKSKAENTVRLVVLKQPELQRDFFSTPEKIQTDGLEEIAILYRIEREVSLALMAEKNKK